MTDELYCEVGNGMLEASVDESEDAVKDAYANGMDAAEFADAPESGVE